MSELSKSLWSAMLSALLCWPHVGLGRDVRFNSSCAEGEALCAGVANPANCLHVCVYDRGNDEFITPVSRLVVKTTTSNNDVVEDVKSCVDREAIEGELTTVFTESSSVGNASSCKVYSDESKGTQVRFQLSRVTDDECSDANARLSELATDCQNSNTFVPGTDIDPWKIVGYYMAVGLVSLSVLCCLGMTVYFTLAGCRPR